MKTPHKTIKTIATWFNAPAKLFYAGLLVASFTAVICLALSAPPVSAATNAEEVCSAIGAGTDCNTPAGNGNDVNVVITTVVMIFSIVIGVIAVIMIMVSGFKYVTSSGDTGKVTAAKTTLIYALVGLIIAALAQPIVNVALSVSTNNPPAKASSDSTDAAAEE